MKRASLLLVALFVLPAAAGLTDLDNPGPSVTSVTARQRYPWNGLVDVDVTFEGKSGETYRIELSATDKTGGTNLPVRTAWLEGATGAVGNPVDVPAPGTHRLVWNAGADLPAGFVADRVTVSAKLLNPIWSFESIPEIDPNDVWAPATVYHDVQTVAAYGEIEDHEPTVRCLTDEWNLEGSLGANVVFSGSSIGLRNLEGSTQAALWTKSDSDARYRAVVLDYENGEVHFDNRTSYTAIYETDARFFNMKGDPLVYVDTCREGYDSYWRAAADATLGTTLHLLCRYQDAEHGSAVCGYFPNGIPLSDASSTSVSSFDTATHSAVFFAGVAGTDLKQTIVKGGADRSKATNSVFSCMANPVGRYVVPLLDGNKYFTVGHLPDRACAVQHFVVSVGRFSNFGTWDFSLRSRSPGYHPSVCWSKGVAMPDGERIFLGGAGRNYYGYNGSVRMWQGSDTLETHTMYPYGHPFESWARRDVTCLLPNGKFCGVDEELGLVVVNPLTGETYVASDDPVFKKGKMGCQLLPNGKVWIIPYDCEGREFSAGTNLCGKLYEVDFGFTRSFSLSSLCSPYLKVAEGDPEPSGIKVGLDPNGGELPGIYAMYYKGENPVYGELPVPTWTGHTFLGWSTDGTAANLIAATDPVPPLGILLKAAWRTHTYTVKFNANGGSGTMADQTFAYGTAQALRANAFTLDKRFFSGWATSASGAVVYKDGQSVKNLTAVSGGTVTLYAKWSETMPGLAVRYYDLPSSEYSTWISSESSAIKAFASKMCTASGDSARFGDTFDSGRMADNIPNIFPDLTTVGIRYDNAQTNSFHGQYAILATNYFAAVFGGRIDVPTTGAYEFGISADDQSLLYVDGIRVAVSGDWKTLGTGSVNLSAGEHRVLIGFYEKTSSQGLFLLWKRPGDSDWSPVPQSVLFHRSGTDNTSFNANGGSGTMPAMSVDRNFGDIAPANSFARTGHSFAGWATSANGAVVYENEGGIPPDISTLYAKWTPIAYSVKFNANGGSGSMSNESFTYGKAKALTANSFARTGYTFGGWATSAGGTKAYNDKQTVSNLTATAGGTVNLYAKWTANTYSVKFNKNATDATGSMSNESFAYGTAKALTANSFARTGYTFGGWATSATGAKAYDDKQSVSNLTTTSGGTVNLYAVWTPITYSVKFNANGGAGTMSNESFTYGTAKALTANAFTRTGYTFGGWATSASGSKVYNDKQSVSNLTTTPGGTVNLYAVWTKALYMVIDLSGGSSATTYPVSYLSAVPSGGWTDEYKTTKLVLRRISAGTFTMGSPTSELGRYDNETSHSVTLSKDYFIGVFEVTQRQWELVMGTRPSYFSNATYYQTRPVEQIAYNAIRGSSSGSGWPSSSAVDSESFIGKIRSRTGIGQFDLPTEAQWEFACRAGTTTAVSNGKNLTDRLEDSDLHTVARYAIDWTVATQASTTSTGTSQAGSLQANPWGLYDMHGNVWEWCLDWDGSLGTTAATDPKGASAGSARVIRGGAWDCMAYNCRSARRGAEAPASQDANDGIFGHYGFRLSCTP